MLRGVVGERSTGPAIDEHEQGRCGAVSEVGDPEGVSDREERLWASRRPGRTQHTRRGHELLPSHATTSWPPSRVRTIRPIERVLYASATLGQFLLEFADGLTVHLAAVLRVHLVNLAGRTDLLPGIELRAFTDIDSLLRPVHGAGQARGEHRRTRGRRRQVLRRV